jgi:mevalonate kinase
MPESSDFDNVVTIFDINRSTMEIRRAQYSLNNKKQREMFETLNHINSMSQRLMDEISQQASEEGNRLLSDSNALMQLFYTREVPCSLLCVELDQLADKVREENEEFERLLRISTRFASLKVPLEETMLKLARIDQRFHVREIVTGPVDPTPLEYDF